MASRFIKQGSALSRADLESNKHVVLATYRHLLRATRIAFQGDAETLNASRAFARTSFRENSKVEAGGSQASQGVEHAQGVIKILRENVVQGRHKGGDHYKLNIHEHTQKLDNETTSLGKGTVKSFKEIKESTF